MVPIFKIGTLAKSYRVSWFYILVT